MLSAGGCEIAKDTRSGDEEIVVLEVVGWGVGGDIRERNQNTVTSLISSPATVSLFCQGQMCCRENLKYAYRKGREPRERRNRRVQRKQKQEQRRKRGESMKYFLMPQCNLEEASSYLLRCSGWWDGEVRTGKGSRGGLGGRGVPVRLEAGMEGGPGEGRKDGMTWGMGRLQGGE